MRTGHEREVVIARAKPYLRYAAHSSACEYLMAGDIVERRWRHPRGYVCVKVISSRSAPQRTAGHRRLGRRQRAARALTVSQGCRRRAAKEAG